MSITKLQNREYSIFKYLDIFNIPKVLINIILEYKQFGGLLRYSLTEQTNIIICLEVLPNGDLMCESYDGFVTVWRENKQVNTSIKRTYAGKCVKVSPNGDIVKVDYDKTIKIWRNNSLINSLK